MLELLLLDDNSVLGFHRFPEFAKNKNKLGKERRSFMVIDGSCGTTATSSHQASSFHHQINRFLQPLRPPGQTQGGAQSFPQCLGGVSLFPGADLGGVRRERIGGAPAFQ